jgi:hypothetical protein
MTKEKADFAALTRFRNHEEKRQSWQILNGDTASDARPPGAPTIF